MLDFLFTIGDYLKYFYLLVLLAGIFYFRNLNTFNIVALVLFISEIVMNAIRDPFFGFVNNIPLEDANILWYLAWAGCHFLTLILLFTVHEKVRVRFGKEATFISISLLALITIQGLGFLEATYIKSEFISALYVWGLPSINISMGLYLLISLVSEIRNAKHIGHSNVY